jgi:Holliday junction DNA helicase RuvA
MLLPMIAHLRGTISKGAMGEATVDVGGVGYRVSVPMNTWDILEDGSTTTIWTSAYIREDRFDLFGFADAATRTLFESLIALQGIGPRMGLELCAVPRGMILQAISADDPKLLMSIKGIGKKSAEKLLIELKNLAEKQPLIFQGGEGSVTLPAQYDRDAVAALSQLGYTTSDIMQALEQLPKHLSTTEERVSAALRVL